MLTDAKITFIRDVAREYWVAEVTQGYFVNLAQGKEIGHKLADLVDEKTSALVTLRNLTKHEYGKSGSQRARSMG